MVIRFAVDESEVAKVMPEPVPVALLLMVNCVLLVMLLMVDPAGILAPEIAIPVASPRVELTVTTLLPLVVEPPPTPTASVRPEPVPDAFVLMVNCVLLVMELMVAPAGILVPDTAIPGTSPSVEPTVTTLLPLVVAPPATELTLAPLANEPAPLKPIVPELIISAVLLAPAA